MNYITQLKENARRGYQVEVALYAQILPGGQGGWDTSTASGMSMGTKIHFTILCGLSLVDDDTLQADILRECACDCRGNPTWERATHDRNRDEEPSPRSTQAEVL